MFSAQARHLTVTVSKLSNLTTEVIHEALTERLEHFSSTVQQSSASQAHAPVDKDLPANFEQQSQRSVPPRGHTLSPSKAGVLSGFLRRKKPQSLDSGLPPPTPPKDVPKDRSMSKHTSPQKPHNTPPKEFFQAGMFAEPLRRDAEMQTSSPSKVQVSTAPPDSTRRQMTDDFVHVSHSASQQPADEEDEVVLEPFYPSSLPSAVPVGPQYSKSFRRKWGQEPFAHLTAAEKVQKRIEAQKRMEEEEEEAMRQEAERQTQLRLKKQQILKQELEEDQERRRQASEEAKQIVAERSKRAKMIKEEEDRKSRELAEKKMLEKRKRMEETRKLEEWRKEMATKADEEARRQDAARKAEEEARRSRIQQAEARIRSNATDAVKSGWVTVQTNVTLAWKRRFFKVNGAMMVFYRSPKVRLLAYCYVYAYQYVRRTHTMYWTALIFVSRSAV
jgi:hypothetical protein